MEKRKKGRKAFSLVEVLISISVISIGMLGAMGAIAFGLRASDRGSSGTFALAINQRTIEMMLNGYPAGGVSLANGNLNTASFPDASINGVFDQSISSNLWHPIFLYPDWCVLQSGQNTPTYQVTDFASSTATAQQLEFAKLASKYQSNINISFATSALPAPTAATNMVQIRVSTRWRDKGGWRCVITDALANGTRP